MLNLYSTKLGGTKPITHYRFLFFLLFITLLSWWATTSSTLLVVSPHPDDDVLMASGVIYAAKQRAEPTTIVYMTNGDYFGPAMGYLREDEAVTAQGSLGLAESNLIFLGYPDAGLATIYSDYPLATDQYLGAPSGQTVTYADRGLGGTDYHYYKFGTHASYNYYNLVNDLSSIINTLRPTHIIVPAWFDIHSDHSTTYYAVRDAVLAVTAANPSYIPVIDEYLVHFYNDAVWPDLANPLSFFTEPPEFVVSGVNWTDRESLDVPLSMQSEGISNPKYLAISAHVSQGGNDGFLGKFLNKDEFFWPIAWNGNDKPPRVDAGRDQTVLQGATVTLDASSSSDPDSTALTYHWLQIDGPSVILMNSLTAKPSFVAPTGLSTDTTLTFGLTVSDGILDTLPDDVSVHVLSASSVPNIAPQATVTASSQNTATNQQAVKAVDTVVDGYPGDSTREWATVGEHAGAWIQLNWSSPYVVNQVVLHDRPNLDDQITGATLTFSDGTTITTGALDNTAVGLVINVNPVLTKSLRVTVATVSGTTQNIGLSELEVYGIPPPDNTNASNITSQATVTASSQNTVTNQQAVKAVDGVVDGYPGDSTREWATVGEHAGAWIQLNWSSPYLINEVVLHDRPNLDDQITGATLTFSDGSTVKVGALDNAGSGLDVKLNPIITNSLRMTVTSVSGSTQNVGLSELEVYGTVPPGGTVGTNIASQATVTASSQNTATNQQAAKAVDGVVDGYPGDSTREWATVGEAAGAWIQLNWSTPYKINQVVLHDRPNLVDQITGATLIFSDGTTVTTGVLDNAGAGLVINVNQIVTSSLRVVVTTVSGTTVNIGLSELEVYGVPASN